MIEYRLYGLNESLGKLFEELDIFVAEEEFGGERTFLIYSEDDIGDVLTAFKSRFESKNVEETGWQDKWKEFVKEDWLTDSFYFVFEPKTFLDGRKTIHINPAMAFGTGAHPTTRAAARLLEKIAFGKAVLDVGTGSGILAILAEKNGASFVEAFDIDPEGLSNCLENIENNGCSKIKAVTGDISMFKGRKFQIVLANIISGVLKEIAPALNEIAEEYIVYSGILASEYDSVIGELIPEGGFAEEKLEINGWVGVRIKTGDRHAKS